MKPSIATHVFNGIVDACCDKRRMPIETAVLLERDGLRDAWNACDDPAAMLKALGCADLDAATEAAYACALTCADLVDSREVERNIECLAVLARGASKEADALVDRFGSKCPAEPPEALRGEAKIGAEGYMLLFHAYTASLNAWRFATDARRAVLSLRDIDLLVEHVGLAIVEAVRAEPGDVDGGAYRHALKCMADLVRSVTPDTRSIETLIRKSFGS